MQYLFLDTNILGQLCHPTAEQFKDLKHWAFAILQQSGSQAYQLCLPEIVDYELRRKLLHMALQQGRSESNSLARLNNYLRILKYIPLQTSTMNLAAQLWAEARLNGLPTASSNAMDGDVILAAQAAAVLAGSASLGMATAALRN
jgi:hypothetical protein